MVNLNCFLFLFLLSSDPFPPKNYNNNMYLEERGTE